MWQGIESVWGSAKDVGAAISLTTGEADTAWGEYESGYEALGGEDFKRPEWGDKGYFKSLFSGPEGEVSIGEGKERKTYDIEKVRKAGAFLGTEAATLHFSGEKGDEIRDQYLKRTVPGRADPLRGKLKSSLTHMTGDTGTGFGQGLGMGFSGRNNNVSGSSFSSWEGDEGRTYSQSPDFLKDYNPSIAGGERGRDAAGTVEIQGQQHETLRKSARIDEMLKARKPFSYGDIPTFEDVQDPYTDEQREPYMESPRNLWDTQIKNNRNRVEDTTNWIY